MRDDVYWASQDGWERWTPTQPPTAAPQNHLRVDQPSVESHPFTYQVKHAPRPFTKSKFVGEGKEDSTCSRSHEPSQGHGIRPHDWIYSRVPTQMTFDVMKAKSRCVVDYFLLHLLRKHAIIIASYIQAVSTVHEAFVDAPSALRHARRPAQSHIEGKNTPPGLTIVRCRGSRFPPSSLVGVASSPRTCSPHLRSRSTACFRPFAEQVIPSLSIIVFSSRTLFIPLTKHTTPSPIRGEHKIKHL